MKRTWPILAICAFATSGVTLFSNASRRNDPPAVPAEVPATMQQDLGAQRERLEAAQKSFNNPASSLEPLPWPDPTSADAMWIKEHNPEAFDWLYKDSDWPLELRDRALAQSREYEDWARKLEGENAKTYFELWHRLEEFNIPARRFYGRGAADLNTIGSLDEIDVRLRLLDEMDKRIEIAFDVFARIPAIQRNNELTADLPETVAAELAAHAQKTFAERDARYRNAAHEAAAAFFHMHSQFRAILKLAQRQWGQWRGESDNGPAMFDDPGAQKEYDLIIADIQSTATIAKARRIMRMERAHQSSEHATDAAP